jgi:ABC-type multidrug transport system fused ATPase/permease subunit
MSESLAERAATPTPIGGRSARERLADSGDSGLPRVWSGKRRRHLTLLILAGLGQAMAAGFSARIFSQALSPAGVSSRWLLFGVLLAAAVSVGLLRMAERVLAERLSQDYVHEIRLGLIRRNLLDGRVRSLGVAVARTTNDLTSVKNWISQGVAPLAVGIPLVIGVAIALLLLNPLLAAGLLVPVIIMGGAMRILGPVAYQRTRRVRRLRGRLSSQVADTLLSTAAIRSAGGSDRELTRIERYSKALVAASVERAKVAGAMRGVAAATSAIATATVIGAGLLAGLPTHSIAGALAIVGFLSGPINDLGRVVEYRQIYRAARRIIGPAIEHASPAVPTRAGRTVFPFKEPQGVLAVACLPLGNGTTMPELVARPGDRIVLDAGDPRLTSEMLTRFVGLREAYLKQVVVGGHDLSFTTPKELRALVGYAAQGMMLGRGSISRTVRYRCPDTDPAEVSRLLAEVDLLARVAELGDGADTILVRGGEPLTIPERARLLLARAILDNPPLLVFDHLDADLGWEGRHTMQRLLADYPGVVILASDDPRQVVEPTHIWRQDGVHQATPTSATGQVTVLRPGS